MTPQELYELRCATLDAALDTMAPGDPFDQIIARAQAYEAYVLQPLVAPELTTAMIELAAGKTVH
jgi:hypothetical protein